MHGLTCADARDRIQREMRIDRFGGRHWFHLLDVIGLIIFGQVKEEDALADVVMISAKLLIAIEA
jgi:hypothetical protein